MTRVYNLLTRAEVWYSLPPCQAVYCAAVQFPDGNVGKVTGAIRRDFHTFEYAGREAPLTTSGRVAFLNHWAAIAKEKL